MLAPQLLRTRVARRILGLFLLCAILPIATFALLAYRLTAARLESDARNGLRQNTKTVGMVLMNRLHTMVSELGGRQAGSSYEAISVEQGEGRLESRRGLLLQVPALSRQQEAHVRSGFPVVLTDRSGSDPRILVGLPTSGAPGGYPRYWGAISPLVLIGDDSTSSVAPDGTELCLVAADGAALSCPSAEAAQRLAEDLAGDDSERTWTRGDSTFVLARWQLFLGAEFAAPAWSVGLSMPESAALLPLATFRRTFILAVALAAVLVFVFSHIQLRKRMTPLAELDAGVRRIGEGDFATPVVVRSNDEFEMLATSFNGMAADLRNQFLTLTALRSVDVAALESQSATTIARAALRSAAGLVEGSRALVAFARPGDGAWTVISAGLDGTSERISEVAPTAGELLQLEVGDLLEFPAGVRGHNYFGEAHLSSGGFRVVFPLRQNGRIQAALVIGRSDGSGFPLAALERGHQLAGQLAIGLASVSLLSELDALSHGSMLALARSIDAASPWTAGHSERVTQGALEIGRRLGFDRSALDLLRRGGLLHDIGKIGVPASILDKPAKLTDAERKVIESHPVIGAEIIKPIAAFREIRPLVLYHHELLDGSGYPDGLSGEAIPLLVRVLTVADIFDALVSDRPYRAGLTPLRALQILQEGTPHKFDSRAVEALEQSLRDGWSGMTLAEAESFETVTAMPLPGTPEPNVREEVMT